MSRALDPEKVIVVHLDMPPHYFNITQVCICMHAGRHVYVCVCIVYVYARMCACTYVYMLMYTVFVYVYV